MGDVCTWFVPDPFQIFFCTDTIWKTTAQKWLKWQNKNGKRSLQYREHNCKNQDLFGDIPTKLCYTDSNVCLQPSLWNTPIEFLIHLVYSMSGCIQIRTDNIVGDYWLPVCVCGSSNNQRSRIWTQSMPMLIRYSRGKWKFVQLRMFADISFLWYLLNINIATYLTCAN